MWRGIVIESCGACGGRCRGNIAEREREHCVLHWGGNVWMDISVWRFDDGHLVSTWYPWRLGNAMIPWWCQRHYGITSELRQEWEEYCHKSQNLEIKICSKHTNQTTQMVQKRLHETCSSSRIGHDTSLCVFRYILSKTTSSRAYTLGLQYEVTIDFSVLIQFLVSMYDLVVLII